MLIEKNRIIARQRRQIGWLFLFILIGIIWIFSLKEDIENAESTNDFLKIAINKRDTTIVELQKKLDSLKSKPVEIPVVIEVKKPKKVTKKDTIINSIDTDNVNKILDTTTFQKKDSL
jgi:hypothetical protein